MSDFGDALAAIDWTDFDHKGQFTSMLSLMISHGR